MSYCFKIYLFQDNYKTNIKCFFIMGIIHKLRCLCTIISKNIHNMPNKAWKKKSFKKIKLTNCITRLIFVDTKICPRERKKKEREVLAYENFTNDISYMTLLFSLRASMPNFTAEKKYVYSLVQKVVLVVLQLISLNYIKP